jgi:hypothetical protein
VVANVADLGEAMGMATAAGAGQAAHDTGENLEVATTAGFVEAPGVALAVEIEETVDAEGDSGAAPAAHSEQVAGVDVVATEEAVTPLLCASEVDDWNEAA